MCLPKTLKKWASEVEVTGKPWWSVWGRSSYSRRHLLMLRQAGGSFRRAGLIQLVSDSLWWLFDSSWLEARPKRDWGSPLILAWFVSSNSSQCLGLEDLTIVDASWATQGRLKVITLDSLQIAHLKSGLKLVNKCVWDLKSICQSFSYTAQLRLLKQDHPSLRPSLWVAGM